MTDETLIRLPAGGHVGTSERIERGDWPHPALEFEELVRHLARHLKTVQLFPPAWRPAKEDEIVCEGGGIENGGSGRFIYRSQRSNAINPTACREQVSREFSTAEAAARHYLTWDLHIPGNLDGWKVI